MAELTVPQINFGSLADLPKVYRDARSQATRDQILSSSDPNNLSLADLTNRLLVGGDLEGAKGIAAIQQAQAMGGGVYGTPIYGTDAQGNTVLGAIGKNGAFRKLDTGGVTPTPGVKFLDTGTGYIPMNSRTAQPMGGQTQINPGQSPAPPQQAPMAQPSQPATQPPVQPRQPSGYIPKDVAGEARQKKQGTEEGENLAAFGKAKAGLETAINSMDRLAARATQIMNHPGTPGIVGLRGMFYSIPGGEAANAAALLENLKSQTAFGALQAMREASKTGGALGNVSDAEGKRLENAVAAIGTAQDLPSFKKAMGELIRYANEAKLRMTGAFRQDYERLKNPGAVQPVAAPQAPSGVVDYSTYFGGAK